MKEVREFIMKCVFLLTACASIAAVVLICIFMFANGLPAIGKIGPLNFLLGEKWKPMNNIFGILPMIIGSIYVTAGAIIIGVPIAFFTSVYLAKFCNERLYKILKPAVELMAGIPSIVYGFFGLVVIVPIMQKKEGVLEKAEELRSVLASNFRVKVDDSDKSPGFKFAEQEVKGIPLRVEVGPKDIEAGQAVVVRRDTREKTIVPFDKLAETCEALLAQMHDDMYAKAKAHRDANTHVATNWDEFTDILEKKQGFIKAMWCGEEACETAIKDETGATTRCIPFAQEKLGDVCVHCGKPAKHMVYFGKAY